jgi:hypothetical protein
VIRFTAWRYFWADHGLMRALFVLIALLSVASPQAQEVDDRQLKGQLTEAMNRKEWPEVVRIAEILLQYNRDEEWIWRYLSCAQRLLGEPEEACGACRPMVDWRCAEQQTAHWHDLRRRILKGLPRILEARRANVAPTSAGLGSGLR